MAIADIERVAVMIKLIDWLLEQIAEDERVATADQSEPATGPAGEAAPSEATATWDPARVLAECEAKRRILSLHVAWSPGWCKTCNVPGNLLGSPHGCPTVRVLAATYASRPGYCAEWRP